MSSTPITNDEPTPSQGATQRGGRGRGSIQRNQDKFRAKKGAEFNAQNRKRIEERCYAHLTELTLQLNKVEIKSVSIAKQLPVTTRAIGFVTNEVFQKAQSRVPNLNVNVFQLYRASLLQFELQVQQAYTLNREEESYPKPKRNDCDRFVTSRDVILSRPKNFLPLSSIINSFGHFVSFNSTYHPYIPKPFIKFSYHRVDTRIVPRGPHPVTGIVPQVAVVGNDADGVVREIMINDQEAIYEERFVVDRTFMPDPYVVTISNLRDTVVALSSENCPPEISSYFYYRNPIPGAVWRPFGGGFVLMNPNDIMPDNYGRHQIKVDLDRVQEWLSQFKGKVGYADGACEFSGKGMISQLISSNGSYRIVDGYIEIENENFYSPESVSDNLFYLGSLSLFGEYPDSVEVEVGRQWHPPAIYSPRHHSIMSHLLPVSFDTVLQAVMK